jgi:hypothetical protein
MITIQFAEFEAKFGSPRGVAKESILSNADCEMIFESTGFNHIFPTLNKTPFA